MQAPAPRFPIGPLFRTPDLTQPQGPCGCGLSFSRPFWGSVTVFSTSASAGKQLHPHSHRWELAFTILFHGGDCFLEQKPPAIDVQIDGGPVWSPNIFLDQVGEVALTLDSTGLSWSVAEPQHQELSPSTCLGIDFVQKSETHVKFADVYAVEFVNWGLIHGSILQTTRNRLLGHDLEMYRFTVHGAQRSRNRPSLWVLTTYMFGHKDLQTCQMWVNQINGYLNMERGRPKSLLVFVHPMSGKGNGCKTWDAVAPIFSRAKVKTKVIVTKRAGHAFGVIASIANMELHSYDGVVAVGGDGFFNEILNGLLSSKHKAPYPPTPADLIDTAGLVGSVSIQDPNDMVSETQHENGDHSPLLPNSNYDRSRSSISDQDPEFAMPNEWFRFGIIPAGSTDAVVICTTGARDPITSALHIILGRKVCLDIAQVVRWKTSSRSKDEPCVRYAASFAGYGFYGDVITESEKYRWMGPKRYDYAGTKVFFRHRSYEAEIAYLEAKSEKTHPVPENGPSSKTSEKVICRANCAICSSKSAHAQSTCPATTYSHAEELRWLKCKGRFLSVGAAIISCRNERAPDGLVADAHLSDGFLHLILIKDCPHAFYLWHLTELARKNGNPLKFDFVEHHKTQAFTFSSSGKESVWNLDGELFEAQQLSAQVFRGLVNLFAPGPEV